MEDKEKMSKETEKNVQQPAQESTEGKEFQPSFLFESEEEIEGLSTGTRFGKLSRKLHETAKSEVFSASSWENMYFKLLDLSMEDDVSEEESSLVLGRLTEKLEKKHEEERISQEKMLEAIEATAEQSKKEAEIRARTEGLKNLSEMDKAEQKALVIGMVEIAESTRTPLVSVPGVAGEQTLLMRGINRYLEDEALDPEIKSVAEARLSLHHCSSLVYPGALAGRTEEVAAKIYASFSQKESKKWALNGERLEVLFNPEKTELNVGKAFNYLQEAYIKGVSVDGALKKLGDKLSVQDRKIIEQKLIEQVGGDEKKAKKSLELAERIADATLEKSVWNTKPNLSDPMAVCVWLEEFRKSEQASEGNRGPDINIDRIKGLGHSSFFRTAKTTVKIKENPEADKEYNKYLHLPDLEYNPEFLTQFVDAEYRVGNMLRRTRGEVSAKEKPSVDESLNVKDMDFANLPDGAYESWFVGIVPLLKFKDFVLKSTWKPEDLNLDSVEAMVAPSDKADPEKVFGWKAELVLGILGETFEDPGRAAALGWDGGTWGAAKKNLITSFEDKKGDWHYSYLRPEDLDNVLKILKKAHINVSHNASVATALRISLRRFSG